MMFANSFRGQRVLVTGHTGFKGAWLALWLKELGARVFGLGLNAPTQPNLYEIVRDQVFVQETTCDIRDLSRSQLESFTATAKARGIAWALTPET